MDADFDLFGDGSVELIPPSGRGGRRPGAGRKKGYSPKRAKEMADAQAQDEAPEGDLNDVTSVAARKAVAVARKESALADQAELKYKIDSGKYIPRAEVQDACATLLAAVGQSLRSLPDLLERKCALSPEVVARVEVVVDECLAELAEGLAMFTVEDR